MKNKSLIWILSAVILCLPFYIAYELFILDKVYFYCPIDYKDNIIIIRHDYYGQGDFLAKRNGGRRHNGIDLQAPLGTPVYAVRGGRVINAEFQKGLGNYVEIMHPSGYVTIYGHLSKISVVQNQRVRQKDKIGEVGKTGNANFRGLIPHLHLEIRKDGLPDDPADYLP